MQNSYPKLPKHNTTSAPIPPLPPIRISLNLD